RAPGGFGEHRVRERRAEPSGSEPPDVCKRGSGRSRGDRRGRRRIGQRRREHRREPVLMMTARGLLPSYQAGAAVARWVVRRVRPPGIVDVGGLGRRTKWWTGWGARRFGLLHALRSRGMAASSVSGGGAMPLHAPVIGRLAVTEDREVTETATPRA